MVSRLDGSGRRLLGGAPRRKCYNPEFGLQPRIVCEATHETSVDALALYHRQLALIDTFDVKHSISGSGLPTEVRLESTGGGPQQLVAILTPGEGGESWVGPSWLGGKLFFYKNGEGPYPFVYRFDPRRNRYAGARAYADLTGFSMASGQRAYEATSAPGSTCGETLACVMRLTQPFAFKPSRAPVHGFP